MGGDADGPVRVEAGRGGRMPPTRMPFASVACRSLPRLVSGAVTAAASSQWVVEDSLGSAVAIRCAMTQTSKKRWAEVAETGSNRLERRKARTRAALVAAAQGFISAGKPNAPILEITQAADVGMGSFYNHFDSREDLFQAAVEDALDRYGAMLDSLTVDVDDPAHVFTQSFRLIGRLHRLAPTVSKVLLNNWQVLVSSEKGLAPRARRDIDKAVQAGIFAIRDIDLTMTVVSGSVLCLGQFLHDHPERDAANASDQVAEDLLRMFGLSAREAHEISRRPLPPVTDLPIGDMAIAAI